MEGMQSADEVQIAATGEEQQKVGSEWVNLQEVIAKGLALFDAGTGYAGREQER